MVAPKWDERRQWIKAYNLELLLCSFVMFFGTAFVYLTLLPSIYHNTGSHKMDNMGGLDLTHAASSWWDSF